MFGSSVCIRGPVKKMTHLKLYKCTVMLRYCSIVESHLDFILKSVKEELPLLLKQVISQASLHTHIHT